VHIYSNSTIDSPWLIPVYLCLYSVSVSAAGEQSSLRANLVDAYPPLLYPATVTGSVTLPKILSQMLRQDPLRTKYCHLDLKAPHMVVDFGAVNALGVVNFSLAIIMYRLWYTHVMEYFEKVRES
jgi:hypothetical protein